MKSEVSCSVLGNNSSEIIAVGFTANFTTVITEGLTHAAGSSEKRSDLAQIVSVIEELDAG